MTKRHPEGTGMQVIDGTAVVLIATPDRPADLSTVRDWRRWLARYVRAFDAGRLSSTDLTRIAYVANVGGKLCESETVDALRDDLERLERETRTTPRTAPAH